MSNLLTDDVLQAIRDNLPISLTSGEDLYEQMCSIHAKIKEALGDERGIVASLVYDLKQSVFDFARTGEYMLLTHIDAQAQEIAALKSDLELLVKMSCREQRYECADELSLMGYPMPSHAQNARCPDIADVLQKWENERGNK